MTTACLAQLKPMTQGNRHRNPVITVTDWDTGDIIADVETASWSGHIRQYGNDWRPIEGTLTGLGDGQVEWAVDDDDDEAATPLDEVTTFEIMLKGSFNGEPLYTVVGRFPMCPGGL